MISFFSFINSVEPVAETTKIPAIDAKSMEAALKYYDLFLLAFALLCIIGSLLHMAASRYGFKLSWRMKVISTLVTTTAIASSVYYSLILDTSHANM